MRYKKGQTPTIEPQYLVVFVCTAVVDGAEIIWERKSQLVDRVDSGENNPQLEQTVSPYLVKFRKFLSY